VLSGLVDGILDGSFGVGSGHDGLAKGSCRRRLKTDPQASRTHATVEGQVSPGVDSSKGLEVSLVARVGLVVLEPCGEFVGVVEYLLHGAGHAHHLRDFSRVLMAWTMTGAWTPSTTPIS
jgi:hypothetical protein